MAVAPSGRELAAQHARKAHELLAGVDQTEEQMARMSEDERLQAVASGTFAQVNRNLVHSVAVAQAHALTAVACAWIEDD